MKVVSTLLCVFLSLVVFSQENNIYLNFSDYSENQPCPYDSSQLIIGLDNWDVYQTLDDTWNGTIDSSQCIGIDFPDSNYGDTYIHLASVNTDKALFLRYRFDELSQVQLFPNHIYSVWSSFSFWGDNFDFQIGNTCTEDLCTGVIVGIQIPDSTGTSTDMRWHQFSSYSQNYGGVNSCFATEKFDSTFLREYIVKITIDTPIEQEDSYLRFFSNGIDGDYNPLTTLTEIPAEASYLIDENEYLVPAYSLSVLGGNYLALYTASTYPSGANPSYIEAYPVENAAIPSIINFEIEEYRTLLFQPFTYFRGALVEGSDSLRHEFNLINNGGTMCMSYIVDLIFNGNTSYVHRGGTIDFTGSRSCMMFHDGAHLEIADNTTLDYGKNGNGILMLGKEGTIVFGQNSTLFMDNRLMLREESTRADEQVYIDLKAGSHLIFGENARIQKSSLVENGQMHLNVYMNGGTLDDSKLSAEDRSLIRRIYPEIPVVPEVFSFDAHPNPFDSQLHIDIASPSDQTVNARLFDVKGQLILAQEIAVQKGQQQVSIDTADVTSGIYFLRIGASSLKVIHR